MSTARIGNWEGLEVPTASEFKQLLRDWQLDLDDAAESNETTLGELEDAREEMATLPEWGNCRRGCPAAYLNDEGYCSPACALGYPKGEYVTAVSAA